MHLALPSDSKATYVSRLMIAGVAVAGASLFAMNAPTPTGPQAQHWHLGGESPSAFSWTTPAGETFTGFLNSGSILDELLVTWPEQLLRRWVDWVLSF